MEPIVEFSNVNYSYHTMSGETSALSDISFQILPGEFIAIVGPSGCGKSTLLSIITGLQQPESGIMAIKDSCKIGYMLQRDNLLEWRTVYQNITLGLEIQHLLDKEHLHHVDEMLSNYGLDPFRDAKPSQLSGGMRQRAALIRTLALKPDLLLLDEPFSALDYQTRLEVSDDIGQIIRKEKRTALLVTHDISEAISMSDRVLILSKRPGHIKRNLTINIPKENQTPFSTRFTEEFKEYFNIIWKELN